MSKPRLEGVFVPHITPFRRDGEVDEAALKHCLQFWIKGGLSGLVPCGSNGEAPYLSREERKRVIKTVVNEAGSKLPVIAGTGAISTRETIQLTKDAKDLGVDAALVVTPFYYKHSTEEIYTHYSTVLEAVDLPIVIYNMPKFTGFSLAPSVVHKLASEYDNILGIKDSSGSLSQMAELIRLIGEEASVLAGTADIILPTLMLGGKGALIAVANVAPSLCSALYTSFREGRLEESGRLQARIAYINEVLIRKHNQLAAIKEALNMKGLPAGYPRKPTAPLKEDKKKEIKELLKAPEFQSV
ncbi:MAG: 4-hydroxy-tetrahydrodipicolinate synthase [Candidatus Bathyarchaeota archaeon]|nr:MAG: 4-hydroxy-tetrahydrodipicolinate synthase [Candidatus Bathyarchaeota archaeon]